MRKILVEIAILAVELVIAITKKEKDIRSKYLWKNDKNFLDELLEEVEAKEGSLHLAHVDLVLGEISNLEERDSNRTLNKLKKRMQY